MSAHNSADEPMTTGSPAASSRQCQFDQQQQFGAKVSGETLVEIGKQLVLEQEAVAAIEKEIARLLLVLWGTSTEVVVIH